MEIPLNAMSPILIIGKIMYLAGRLDRIRVSGFGANFSLLIALKALQLLKAEQ